MKKNYILIGVTFWLFPLFAFSFKTSQPFQYGFIENKGQVIDQNNKPNPQVSYLLNAKRFKVQLRSGGFSYEMIRYEQKVAPGKEVKMPYEPVLDEVWLHVHRVDFELLGANKNAEVVALEPSSHYLNYYTTGTGEKGVTGVRDFKKVVYRNIYPHIDLEFIAHASTENAAAFKYNFVIHPGGKVADIRLGMQGASGSSVTGTGGISVKTSEGNFEETLPHSWHEPSGKALSATFMQLEGGSAPVYGIRLLGADPTQTLVIDPMPFATFFGGTLAETAYNSSRDPLTGNLLLTGTTVSTTNIATSGAFQTTYGGSTFDGYLLKLNENGGMIWATYYGGSAADYGYQAVSDPFGNIIFGGYSASTNAIATTGSHQPSNAGLQDAFVVKFNAAGIRLWGTYYGGASANEALYGLLADSTSIFAVGYTNSTAANTAIATAGSYQPAYGTGAYDGFIVRFDTGGVRQWGTYYGGTGDDRIITLAKDRDNNLLVCGQTTSTTAMASAGAHQTTFAGSISGHLAKFTYSGTRIWGTYYGGTQNTVVVNILPDQGGGIVVAGYTGSTSGIATAGSFQPTLGGGPVTASPYDGFMARFTSNGTRLWGTYYGGTDYDVMGFGLAIDGNSNLLMSGYSASTTLATPGAFKTANSLGTPVSAQSPNGFDAFVLKMDTNGIRKWCTYYGGSGMDYGRGVATDSRGYVYVAGYGNSTTGIATPGAYQTTNGGGDDGFFACFNTNGTFDPDAWNNAATLALTAPDKFCAGNQAVKVRIKNNGVNRIDSVLVNWSVDGILQTPLNWRIMLDTVGGPFRNDTIVTLASAYPFLANQTNTIRIWTSMPNGVVDTVNTDDTIQVQVRPALSGTYIIDPLSSDYTNFTAAIRDLNRYGHCGPVYFQVSAGTTYAEAPMVITRSGNATDSIVFYKFGYGANPVIYGVNGTGSADAVVTLQGVSYITFDGISVADSGANATTSLQMEYGFRILNGNSATGASFNRIKNAQITLKRSNTASIGIQSTTALNPANSLSGGNHRNRFENIRVENSYCGILIQGTAAFPDTGNVITSSGMDTTVIGANAVNDIGGSTVQVYGIQLAEQKNAEVSRVVVRNLIHTGTLQCAGIWLNNQSLTSSYGTAQIFNNAVYGLARSSTTATGGFTGISIDVSVSASAAVYNNLVYGFTTANPAAASATMLLRGIGQNINGGSGNAFFYHNTVHLMSNLLNGSAAAFWKGGTGTVTYRNNIFSCNLAAQSGVAKHYAVYISAGTVSLSSNNVLWAPNANGFAGYAGAADRTSLVLLAASISPAAPADGNECGSSFADPAFTSNMDLSFSSVTPASQSAVYLGAPYHLDYAGIPRSLTIPSAGALETSIFPLDSAAPVISNVRINNGTMPTVYATITDNTGVSPSNIRLWYRLGTSGAFTGLAADSFPVSGNGAYKWGASLTALVPGSYTFYVSARDQIAQGVNIAVNPVQATTFTGFSPTDPVNYLNNPDVAANTRTFIKTTNLNGGVYTVGPTGNYQKLTQVANILNTSSLSGNVLFELQSGYDGTTGETFPIVFNEFLSTGGPWNVTIRPASGVTARITSGDPGAGSPLINLSGADRIVMDGRPGGSGSAIEWTLRNTRTAATFGPTLLLNNDARQDTIQFLRLESQNTATNSGTVVLGGTSLGNGNDNNVFRSNEMRDRSDLSGIPFNGFYAEGTSGIANDGTVLENNRFFNWTGNALQVTATGNGNAWRISGNHYYQPSAITASSQTAIRFEPTSSVQHQLSGNMIGGTTLSAGGSAMVTNSTTAWNAMVLNCGSTDSSYVNNNTIQNIQLSGTGTVNGIVLNGGLLSVRNNLTGHATTQNSIQSAVTGAHHAILVAGNSVNAAVYNNTIANMSSSGSVVGVSLSGIRLSQTTGGKATVRNNMVFGLSADNTNTSTTLPALSGVLIDGTATGTQVLLNTVYGLTEGGLTGAGSLVSGIHVANASSNGSIQGNRIYGLANLSASVLSQVSGIHLETGASWSIINNMVALGYNFDSAAVINGILDKTSGNNPVYFNSVVVSGNNAASGGQGSHGYRKAGSSSVMLRNNIFRNIRTGSGTHHALSNLSGNGNGWFSNYNALSTANTATLGNWNGISNAFSAWKIASLGDSLSVNYVPLFVSNTDLHLSGASVGNMLLAGKPVAGITTDIDGQLRHFFAPYIGADEASPQLPVVLAEWGGYQSGEEALLHWVTTQELNTQHFIIEFSKDGVSYLQAGKVKAAGNSRTPLRYGFADAGRFSGNQADGYWYRLRTLDMNGSEQLSAAIYLSGDDDNISVMMGPNPLQDQLFIHANKGIGVLQWVDVNGRVIASQTTEGKTNIQISLRDLPEGCYFLLMKFTDGSELTRKLVK